MVWEEGKSSKKPLVIRFRLKQKTGVRIMNRLPILLILAVFLMGGCAEGIGRDLVRGALSQLKSEYADLYGNYSGQENLLDDGSLTEDEVDCSHPFFTTGLASRFPGGEYPQVLITPPGSYWECSESKDRYHADGTFSSIITSNYQDVLDFWRVCEVGTRPPNLSGVWAALKEEDLIFLCVIVDIFPGIEICTSAVTSSDGSTLTITGEVLISQEGELLDNIEVESETCYLREE